MRIDCRRCSMVAEGSSCWAEYRYFRTSKRLHAHPTTPVCAQAWKDVSPYAQSPWGRLWAVMSRVDMEKLISQVQRHPVLYCTSHPNYARVKHKEEIWEGIGAKLNTEGSVVRDQWQKIRECHREALRRRKRRFGQGSDSSKMWIYERQMEFLLPFMRNKPEANPNKRKSRASEARQSQIETITPKTEAIFFDIDDQYEQYSGTEGDDSQWGALEETTPSIEMAKTSQIQQIPRKIGEEEEGESRTEMSTNGDVSPEKGALHQFFMAMYYSTRDLPSSYQRQVRNQIFHVVSQMEEQYEYDRLK